MSAPLAHWNARQAFEENKESGQVQALLKLLGNRQEQVIAWRIDQSHEDYATFRVVFEDESEARGYISSVPHRNEWIAGGSIIPAFQAKRIRELEENNTSTD